MAVLSSFSALVATYLNNSSNAKRLKIQSDLEKDKNRENLRLLKCEELYLTILKWKSNVFKIHMDWVSFVDGNIDRNELIKKIDTLDITNEILNLHVTIGVYFPSLKADFASCQDKLKPANKVYFSAQKNEISDKRKAKSIIINASKEFENNVDELLSKISSIANFR
ncbi:TPA: hypothetical protein PXN46_001008 [Yersinia enterocolitica]|nr:hypothetical protein [Yersinia enterocolitica]